APPGGGCDGARLRLSRGGRQSLGHRQRPPAAGEARAVALLHDEEGAALRLAEVVEPHDVVVDQAGEDLRLQADPPADLLAGALLEDLDRDAPAEDLVCGAVDGPHAAPAELLIQAESLVQRRPNA